MNKEEILIIKQCIRLLEQNGINSKALVRELLIQLLNESTAK